MPIKTEVTCWRPTDKNNQKNPEKTSFQLQWEKVVSLQFKEQAEKNAKEFVGLAFPPGTFTPQQLRELQFGKMGFYDMLTNMVAKMWIYQFKNGIPIDYELLKRSAESPITIETLHGNIFGKDREGIFLRIKKLQDNQDPKENADRPEERPDLFIEYINSDQFIPSIIPKILSKYINTLTDMLYLFYDGISLVISSGFLDTQQDWFEPRGSLILIQKQKNRVNELIQKLQNMDKDKYKHVTPEKLLKHLAGDYMTLEQALAPDPAKGGKRKRKGTHKRKLRKNKRNCTHKRLTTSKSRIIIRA
jgi:hypothetical protein